MEFKRTIGYKSRDYNLRARCDKCSLCGSSTGGRATVQGDTSHLQREIDDLKIKVNTLESNVEYLKKEIDELKKTVINPCLEDVCQRVDLLYTVLNPSLTTGITINHP